MLRNGDEKPEKERERVRDRRAEESIWMLVPCTFFFSLVCGEISLHGWSVFYAHIVSGDFSEAQTATKTTAKFIRLFYGWNFTSTYHTFNGAFFSPIISSHPAAPKPKTAKIIYQFNYKHIIVPWASDCSGFSLYIFVSLSTTVYPYAFYGYYYFSAGWFLSSAFIHSILHLFVKHFCRERGRGRKFMRVVTLNWMIRCQRMDRIQNSHG